MAINKVVYGGTTILDLTGDTVTADKLMQGYTAHDRSGAVITGTATGGGPIEIGYDELSSVGYAQVGTAVTGTPNYTPSGSVSYTTDTVGEATGGTLNYSYSNYALIISGVTVNSTPKSVVTSVGGLNGNGVTFTAKIAEEE